MTCNPSRPLARHHLHRGHVDVVDVGAFFTVYLDAHEAFVHQRCDLVVLERLALHDVAPVAGRVSDAQQDRLVFAARLLQRRVAPRVPRDRIVGVLSQIRAGFVRQPVGGTKISQL